MQQTCRQRGVDTESEMALFQADHDLNVPAALEQAKSRFKNSPISRRDVLARGPFYKSGQYEDAQSAIQRALCILNSRAVVSIPCRRRSIKAGEKQRQKEYLSRALALNYAFRSSHAPVAKRVCGRAETINLRILIEENSNEETSRPLAHASDTFNLFAAWAETTSAVSLSFASNLQLFRPWPCPPGPLGAVWKTKVNYSIPQRLRLFHSG